MEKFLHDNMYAVTAPCFTMDSSGCVLTLNEAAAELLGAEAVGRDLSTIMVDATACKRLLDESHAHGFAALGNQSLHTTDSFQLSQNTRQYNIFASLGKNQLEISVFISHDADCPDQSNGTISGKTKILADKIKGHKLLQTTWNELFFSRDIRGSLDLLMPLIGKYLGVARVRLLEINSQVSEFVCSHQWFATTEIRTHNPYDTMSLNRLVPSFMHMVKQDGLLLGYDLKRLPSDLRRFLENSGVQSIIALPLNLDGKFHGLISCTNIKENRPLSIYQIDTMLKIAKIISINMSRYYNSAGKRYDINTLQSIISALDTCIGVVDKKNNKVLFANNAFITTTDFSALGISCWNKLVVSNDEDCTECSLADEDFKGHISKDVYLKSIKKWLRIIHEVMYWADGVEHILFSAEDITAIKLDEQRLREGVSIDPVSGALSADTGIELLQKILDNLNATGYAKKYTPKINENPFIAVLTLDHYATIQHSLGTRESITLLKKIGISINNELNVDELCRLSDNEFLLFPHRTESPLQFARQLETLLKNIQDSEPSDIAKYSMETSFALAQADEVDMLSAENLIEYARYKLSTHKKEKTSRTNSMLL